MNDLEKKSIECLKNMPIEEATYQVARSVVLDYITNLQEKYDRMKENAKILSNGYNELEKRNEKANTLLDEMLERAYIDGKYIMYDYSTSELLEVKQALQGEDYNKVERAYLDDEWIGEDEK